MYMVRLSVRIMFLTSSQYKVFAYPAAWHAGIPTLTSSLRPRCYIIPSLAAGLLGCISAYKERTNKQTRNKSHDRPADTVHGETPPPLDCDPKVVKPVPRPFVLDSIQSKKERKKERQLIHFLHYRGFPGWLRWNSSTSSWAFLRFSAGSQIIRTYLYPAHSTR